MIRLEKKNYNIIFTKNQQKYQLYHLAKLINMNILQVKNYYLLIKEKVVIEQDKLTYSPLGKALGKQTETVEDQGEKQIKALYWKTPNYA